MEPTNCTCQGGCTLWKCGRARGHVGPCAPADIAPRNCYCASRDCQKRLGPPSMEHVRFDTSRGHTAYFCNKACFAKENPS